MKKTQKAKDPVGPADTRRVRVYLFFVDCLLELLIIVVPDEPVDGEVLLDPLNRSHPGQGVPDRFLLLLLCSPRYFHRSRSEALLLLLLVLLLLRTINRSKPNEPTAAAPKHLMQIVG